MDHSFEDRLRSSGGGPRLPRRPVSTMTLTSPQPLSQTSPDPAGRPRPGRRASPSLPSPWPSPRPRPPSASPPGGPGPGDGAAARRVPAGGDHVRARHDVLRRVDEGRSAAQGRPPQRARPPPSSCRARPAGRPRGLYWDQRTGLVWAVGNVGAVAVRVGHRRRHRRHPVCVATVAGSGFFNDVVAFGSHGLRHRLARRPARRRAPWLPSCVPDRCAADPPALTGAWPSVRRRQQRQRDPRPPRRHPRAQQQHVGRPLAGGPDHRRDRGAAGHPEVRASSVATDWSGTATSSTTSAAAVPTSVGPWAKRVQQRLDGEWAGARTDETLDVPSTATVAGGWLWRSTPGRGSPTRVWPPTGSPGSPPR